MKKIKPLTLKIFLIIIFADILESAAEIFFKKSALATGISDITVRNLFPFVFKMFSSPILWIGIFIYIFNFLLWMAIYSRTELSVAFPVGSVIYIIVPIFSMFFLHENVTLTRWLGILVICVGIYLVSQSTSHEKVKNEA